MFKKRKENQKRHEFERMEKCIFGMHLAKAQKKWVSENDSSNNQFAKVLCVSPRTKDRAIAGEATVASMNDYAERLGCDVKKMKAVNFHSIVELIFYRFKESDHRRSMLLFAAVMFFGILTIATQNKGLALLMIILGNLFVHSGKNLWNIKMNVDKNPDGSRSKSMIAWDVVAIFDAIILVAIIFVNT